jgi:anion-transporting  ArsA/GET3 family ATPase
VRFVIVTIPEALAVEQLEYIFGEFDRYGFRVDQLIINNVIKETDSPFLRAKAEQQRGYIELLHDRYGELKIVELPLLPYEIKGVERLQDIRKSLFE